MTPNSCSEEIPETPESELRFRGLSASSRMFFVTLARNPCPTAWPGGDRVAYAAHVLSPLKALVSDLGRLLADVSPRLVFEPRVGTSLYWTGNPTVPPEECPIRVVRTWEAGTSPETAPVLEAVFGVTGIEVALSFPESVETALLAAVPEGYEECVAPSGTRVATTLEWEAWIDEPGLAPELADRFRELLPLLGQVRPAGLDDDPVRSDGARTGGAG